MKNPILLLGLFDTAISTAHCFRKQQIEIFGMDYKTEHLGFKSNRIKSITLPNPSINKSETLNFILNWIKTLKSKPVIIPTSDEFIQFCSEYNKLLSEVALFLLPGANAIETIIDRESQFKSVTNCGIKVPELLQVDKLNSERINYPVAIKPANVNEWKKAMKNKGFLIRNKIEFEKAFQEVQNSKVHFLVQKVIDGENSNNFEVNSLYLPNGKIYQHSIQKIRQYPDKFGTATAIKVVENQYIEQLSKKLILEQGLFGFTNIEFKFNSDDGMYYYIETNARVWLQVNFSKKIGLNFPLLYYNYLVGNQVEPKLDMKYKGVWVDILPDLLFFLKYRKSKKIRFINYIRSLIPIASTGLMNMTDPLPILVELKRKFF
jgi:predicted ATP-grasp superfamily ATP-dependent carboligase